MPHIRKRHIVNILEKQASYWPVVGLMGLRQSGKSTTLRELGNFGSYISMDDESHLEDALLSSKNFLTKNKTPLIIDEIQKAPKLFDAIKVIVDKKRIPGQFFLSGSTQFSSKLGIRESLTGRIANHYLYPMTLSEAFHKSLSPQRALPIHKEPIRFKIEEAVLQFKSGGLPVPLYTRKENHIKSYFQAWLETSLIRDVSRVYGKGYNPDLAYTILNQMAKINKDGEIASLIHFKQDSRKVRKYLQAFENIFLIQKLPCHEAGIGHDSWIFSDTGILSYLMGSTMGEGISLSLARVFCFKEILALNEYSGERLHLKYYKSARGSPVDLIWNNIPIKFSVLPLSQFKYDERALEAARVKLKSKFAILCVGHDIHNIKKNGISIVPWTFWS